MLYLGGKSRLAKKLLPIMLPHRTAEQWWVEPFVGGGGMIDKVSNPRLGGDVNRHAIEALTIIRDRSAELPKSNVEFGEDDYRAMQNSDAYWAKGFAGFAYSFGGKWMGGWARNRDGRDYVEVAYRNASKQSENLRGCALAHSSYDKLGVPPHSLIYCDPPYAGTTGYQEAFDHAEFWEWCRNMSSNGHTLFVSEYSAPVDFISVWSGKYTTDMRGAGRTDRTEHLFVWRRTWKDAK